MEAGTYLCVRSRHAWSKPRNRGYKPHAPAPAAPPSDRAPARPRAEVRVNLDVVSGPVRLAGVRGEPAGADAAAADPGPVSRLPVDRARRGRHQSVVPGACRPDRQRGLAGGHASRSGAAERRPATSRSADGSTTSWRWPITSGRMGDTRGVWLAGFGTGGALCIGAAARRPEIAGVAALGCTRRLQGLGQPPAPAPPARPGDRGHHRRGLPGVRRAVGPRPPRDPTRRRRCGGRPTVAAGPPRFRRRDRCLRSTPACLSDGHGDGRAAHHPGGGPRPPPRPAGGRHPARLARSGAPPGPVTCRSLPGLKPGRGVPIPWRTAGLSSVPRSIQERRCPNAVSNSSSTRATSAPA